MVVEAAKDLWKVKIDTSGNLTEVKAVRFLMNNISVLTINNTY